MCNVAGCTQASYFEAPDGACYYHNKINRGLIETPNYTNKFNIKTIYYSIYNNNKYIIYNVINKINLLVDTDRDDLESHLNMYLWESLIPSIRPEADENEVRKYLNLALRREAVRFASELNSWQGSSMCMEEYALRDEAVYNPENVFLDNVVEERRKDLVQNFMIDLINGAEDRLLFQMLFLDDELTFRDISKKLGLGLATIHRRGRKLYDRFSVYVTRYGYKPSDLISQEG